MKISVLAHSKFPIREPFAGGLEAHTHSLCKGLTRLGHQVTLHAALDSDPSIGLRTLAIGDGDYCELQHSYQQTMSQLLIDPPDLVHINSLHYLPVIMAPRLSCPVTMTLHTPPFAELASGVTIERHSGYIRYIAVSEHTARAWQSWQIDNPVVIHNGIDPAIWSFHNHPAPDLALWFGRLCPEKAPHLAIEAARQAGLRLWLCGYIYDRDYFDQQIRPRLSDDIRYLGHQPRRRLNTLLGQAAVCLFSSVWEEPFGLTVIEALTSGTPVAAFDSGAIRELLPGDCGRIVERGDWSALATAARQAMMLDRQRCRQWAEQHFSLNRMIAGYQQVFDDCLGAANAA